MKLKEITVNNAERKKLFKQDTPGVVIATLQSVENKKCVMANKSKLRGTRNFMKVMVYEDKTFQQRKYESNLRPIINTVAKDKLVLRGGSVQNKERLDIRGQSADPGQRGNQQQPTTDGNRQAGPQQGGNQQHRDRKLRWDFGM